MFATVNNSSLKETIMPREAIVVPLEILKPYVIGKVFEYFSSFDMAPEAQGIHNYVTHTLEFVVPYLNGKEVLDARASDTQCTIAMSAYTDFKNYKQS